jgi:hypothetical protein
MRRIAALVLAACTAPCPDVPAFCTQADAGTCVAWPATCCSGFWLCKLDASPVSNAGTCTMVSTPASEAVTCP